MAVLVVDVVVEREEVAELGKTIDVLKTGLHVLLGGRREAGASSEWDKVARARILKSRHQRRFYPTGSRRPAAQLCRLRIPTRIFPLHNHLFPSALCLQQGVHASGDDDRTMAR